MSETVFSFQKVPELFLQLVDRDSDADFVDVLETFFNLNEKLESFFAFRQKVEQQRDVARKIIDQSLEKKKKIVAAQKEGEYNPFEIDIPTYWQKNDSDIPQKCIKTVSDAMLFGIWNPEKFVKAFAQNCAYEEYYLMEGEGEEQRVTAFNYNVFDGAFVSKFSRLRNPPEFIRRLSKLKVAIRPSITETTAVILSNFESSLLSLGGEEFDARVAFLEKNGCLVTV